MDQKSQRGTSQDNLPISELQQGMIAPWDPKLTAWS